MKTSIICTGRSLKGVDLNKIEGHKIAINYAHKYVEHDILVAFDDPIKYEFPIEKLITNIDYVKKYNLDCKGYYRHRSNGIVRDRPDTWMRSVWKMYGEGVEEIFGRSGSVFCAINIALLMGFKEIHIYGADMKTTDGYTHFYSKEKPAPVTLLHLELSWSRHQMTKELFTSQLRPDEKIIWH